MKDLSQALQELDVTYDSIAAIALDIVSKSTAEPDKLIDQVKQHIETLTAEQIRYAITSLSLQAYTFSDIKEKSALKAECAEILRKEKYSSEFNKAEGSVAVRENTAIINVSESVLVEAIYNMVASSLKTKLDEIHRVVDALKSNLVSRMQETKIMQGSMAADGSNPYAPLTGKQTLNE